MKTLFPVTLIALATAVPAAAQSGTGALPAPARMHEAWGENSNSPGTRLTIKEASRSADGFRFRLYVEGVAKGAAYSSAAYSLIAWPITQRGPSEVMAGIGADDSGMAICQEPDACGTDKPGDPLEVSWSPLPGEPIRLGLMSADGAVKLYGKLTAIPLRGDDQGCTLEATLLTPGAELIVIEGKGFAAGSEITLDAGAQKEPRVVKGAADSSGRYLGALQRYRQGSPSGALKVTLTSAQCSPSLNVPLSN